MEHLLHPLFALFGWFYLLLKYRNKTKMRAILFKHYENSYAEAGKDLVTSLFLLLFALLLLLLIVVTLINVL